MDCGMEMDDPRKEDSRGGGGDGEWEPGAARQEKPPDAVTAASPDESQPGLSEVKRCDGFYCYDHIELFFSRALNGTWTA